MENSFSVYPTVILDACCIINLYASGEMIGILNCISTKIAIASYVKEKEVLTIYDGPPGNVRAERKNISLDPLIEAGVIAIATLDGEEENQAYVTFAVDLDDGEAFSGAIALARNWAVVTDDKKATNFFMRNTPRVHTIPSLSIVKNWVDVSCPSKELIKKALGDIRKKAHYEPGVDHPLYKWWQEHLND